MSPRRPAASANGRDPRPGVFSTEMLLACVARGEIAIPVDLPVADEQLQPASLDLRLGKRAYRLRSSFLPGAGSTVEERLRDLQMGAPVNLTASGGAVLERGRPYLIPLVESLALPDDVRGRTNPRSSTGRVDLFTRVITDHGAQFDEIRPGYHGGLWLEVYSNSFTVAVRAGLRLAQLRLSRGEAAVRAPELRRLHAKEGLLFTPGPEPRAKTADPLITGDGLFVRVSLDPGSHVGWRARRDSGLLDLGVSGTLAANDFWEMVFADDHGRLVLEPEQFYLLISHDYVRVPPGLASEMVAYDPTNGELRTHYAGFFDPGFGHRRDGSAGTRAVLEVRAHDVPFMLEDEQPIARLAFERMAAEPEHLYGESAVPSHYQRQEVDRALPRQFAPYVPSRRMALPTG